MQDTSNQTDADIFAKVFADKQLYKRLAPRILLDGEQIEYFLASGRIPERFTPLVMEQEGQAVPVVLKMSRDVMASSVEGNWELEVSKDIRIAALVSLIKAAHLTLFDLLGYRYALSAAGEFVGRQILGEFFRQNRDNSKSDVLQNAHSFFGEFATMVRPILSSDYDFKGTIIDKTLFICWGSSESAWAMIVVIRIGSQLHAVMVPVSSQPKMIATYLGFLRSENESINVSLCQLKQDHWSVSKERAPMNWPKTGILYP